MSSQVYLTLVSIVSVIVSVASILLSYICAKMKYREKVKLDISRELMLESEQKLADFYTRNDIREGQSIYDVAEILNVEEGKNNPNLVSQAYMKNIGNTHRREVVFKSGLSEKEKRFAFAHEIAHVINGDKIPASRPNGRNKALTEQRADYMAAALLMPANEVYNYLKRHNYTELSNRKKVAEIQRLCKKYDVTETIALRRVKEIQSLKQF